MAACGCWYSETETWDFYFERKPTEIISTPRSHTQAFEYALSSLPDGAEKEKMSERARKRESVRERE